VESAVLAVLLPQQLAGCRFGIVARSKQRQRAGPAKSDVPALLANVGYRWKTGQHMLNASFSHFDPQRS
jgi:hypothetical protein